MVAPQGYRSAGAEEIMGSRGDRDKGCEKLEM